MFFCVIGFLPASPFLVYVVAVVGNLLGCFLRTLMVYEQKAVLVGLLLGVVAEPHGHCSTVKAEQSGVAVAGELLFGRSIAEFGNVVEVVGYRLSVASGIESTQHAIVAHGVVDILKPHGHAVDDLGVSAGRQL